MTDKSPTLSPEQAADRSMVDRTSYEKEAIWLPALAVQHWNAGQMFIEGKTFTDCLIEGPGVVAVMNETFFESCAMGTASDIRSLLYRPVSTTKMSGVIGVSNCRFVRCRFAQVGFTGSEELLADLQGGIKLVSEAAAESKA